MDTLLLSQFLQGGQGSQPDLQKMMLLQSLRGSGGGSAPIVRMMKQKAISDVLKDADWAQMTPQEKIAKYALIRSLQGGGGGGGGIGGLFGEPQKRRRRSKKSKSGRGGPRRDRRTGQFVSSR